MQLVNNVYISGICCTAFHNTKCSVHNTLTVKDRSIAVTLHCIHIIHNNRLFPLCALIRVGGFYCTLPVVVDRSWLVYCLSRSCILGRLYWRLLYLYRRTLRICTRGFYGQHLSRVIFLEWVSTAHCCFLYARDTTVALEITTSHFVMPTGSEQFHSSFWNTTSRITTCQFISHKFLLKLFKCLCSFLDVKHHNLDLTVRNSL